MDGYYPYGVTNRTQSRFAASLTEPDGSLAGVKADADYLAYLELLQRGVISGPQAQNSSISLTITVRLLILKYMLNQIEDLDRVFQALADPGRRRMVERLSLGPASVSELARPMAMSLAAVVQHVQVLEASGLVRSEKVGRTRTCAINPGVLRSAEDWIAERRAVWERRLDRLGDFLTETAETAGTPDPSHEPGGNEPRPTGQEK